MKKKSYWLFFLIVLFFLISVSAIGTYMGINSSKNDLNSKVSTNKLKNFIDNLNITQAKITLRLFDKSNDYTELMSYNEILNKLHELIENKKLDTSEYFNQVQELTNNVAIKGEFALDKIPNFVDTIGKNAYKGQLLGNVTIPESIRTIEESAFENAQITSLNLNSQLQIIKTKAFKGVYLKNISIPKKIKVIEKNAFDDILGLEVYMDKDSFDYFSYNDLKNAFGFKAHFFNNENIFPLWKYDCSFTYQNTNPDLSEYVYNNPEALNSNIACLMRNSNNKITNDFPIFRFENLIKELSMYNQVNPEMMPLNSNFVKKAINNAKNIVNYLIKSLSYGSEMALLDHVTFKKENFFTLNGEKGAYYHKPGLYNNQNQVDKEDLTFNHNRNYIHINIPNLSYLVKNPSLYQWKYENTKYNGIMFDFYDVVQTWYHEYGHFLVTHSNTINKESFLEKLKDDYESPTNSRFYDYLKIYKYINNLNPSNSQNYEGIDDRELNDYDKEILATFRNYFKAGSKDLKEILLTFMDTKEVKVEANAKKMINFINTKFLNQKLPANLKKQLKDFLNVLSTSSEGISKEYNYLLLLRNLTNEKYFFFEQKYFGQLTKMEPDKYKYYLLPKSYNDLNNDEKGLLNSDIFANQKYTNLNKNAKSESVNDFYSHSKAPSCMDNPLIWRRNGYFNYDAEIMKEINEHNQDGDFIDNSALADKKILKTLGYFYNFKEQVARMFVALIGQYGDKRKTINDCLTSIEVNDQGTITFTNNPNDVQDALSEYSSFKAFGIDLLANDNEKKYINFLFSMPYLKDRRNNTFYIYKNNELEIQETSDDQDNSEDNRHRGEGERTFFYSYNELDSEVEGRENEKRYLTTLYMRLNVQLANPKNISLLKVQFENANGEIVYGQIIKRNLNNRKVLFNSKRYPYIDDDSTTLVDVDPSNNFEFVVVLNQSITTVAQDESNPSWGDIELGKVVVYIDINNNGIKDDSDVILHQV